MCEGNILERMLPRLQDEEWKNIRSTVTPAFSSGKLKLISHLVNNRILALIEVLEKSAQSTGNVDMKKWVLIFPFQNRFFAVRFFINSIKYSEKSIIWILPTIDFYCLVFILFDIKNQNHFLEICILSACMSEFYSHCFETGWCQRLLWMLSQRLLLVPRSIRSIVRIIHWFSMLWNFPIRKSPVSDYYLWVSLKVSSFLLFYY